MKLLRGWFGEKKTAFKLWLWLDGRVYRRFHHIILPGTNGTTQIDHLLVSPFGLFIVETKNMRGWIFGSSGQAEWTQMLYRKKFNFQNPLRQTYRQKKVLAEFLHLHESTIHTIVNFVGDCTFKTPLPTNVLRSGLSRYIKRFKEPILSSEELERVLSQLERHRSSSTLTRRDHLRSLRSRHASKTVCPNCGGELVQRTARRGPSAGMDFLGCSNYPKCRFTRDV